MRKRIETERLGDSSNPAIFMVSGWAMPKDVMRPFAERLSQRFFVVMANLPGISLDGQWISHSRVGSHYDMDALSEQLIAVAPKESWWIGWSLGGMASAYVAAHRSSCVKGLITLSASPSFVQRDGWPHGMDNTVFDQFFELTNENPEQGLKRFVMLQTKGAEEEKVLAKKILALLPTTTLNKPALMGGLRALKSLDIRREWSLLDRPNLHILGANDALVSPEILSTQTDANPFQEVIVMPGVAHQCFMEQESLCLRHIENFIDANDL